jgi:ABC-type antimicrobial peptide transport system permease subunit
VAYVVAQRSREIGVRIALGATRANVVATVLEKAAILVATGLAVGSIGAWYLNATAKAFLFQRQSNDPRAFVAAALSLSLAAFIASVVPARCTASVDPMVALRSE